jgi:glycosyltransferase involved in cell wall biosynthesis
MRKLLIVDPSLQSLEGHSYNYDLAIYQAAGRRFDEVVVYADRQFRDASGRMRHCRAILNRLRVDHFKRLVNSVFHRWNRKPAAGDAAHSTVVPGVWSWTIRFAKWLRAIDLQMSLHAIIREHGPGDELHVFIQHAHLSELQLAGRWNENAHLHLVLRYSPDLVNNGQLPAESFRSMLCSLGPLVHLYTDSGRLSAEYGALGARGVTTLPVPILLPESIAPAEGSMIKLAFLGSPRVEKGFCELPRLIERLPRESNGRTIGAMVQVNADSADPRIREAAQSLANAASRLPPGTVELLPSPAPADTYYGWMARAGIVALPYLSKKYNASTSGIFVEALCFGVPVICPAESWMADVVDEAQQQRLRIGEVVATMDEIPAAAARIAGALPEYRDAVRRFAAQWRRIHNPEECVRRLLGAAA